MWMLRRRQAGGGSERAAQGGRQRLRSERGRWTGVASLVDRLSAILAVVDHQSVAIGEPQVLCHLARHDHQVAEQRRVIIRDVLHHRNRLLGDDEHMRGRLRVDVVKCEALVILIGYLGRDLLPNCSQARYKRVSGSSGRANVVTD